MREYQKNFITLYNVFQNAENRARKAEKFNYILNKLKVHDPNGNCLDTGCSSGIITNSLSPLFKNVFGIDIDMMAMQMIDKSQSDNTAYAYADAMKLPFRDASFEGIICSQTYEHVPSSAQLFLEIERVIKPGGVVIFSGPNKTFPIEPHYYLPFLHWLNEKKADAYLKITGKGDHYYERSRTYWDLKKTFANYEIIDVVKYVLEYYSQTSPKSLARIVYKVASKLPLFILRLISPFMVNINWILIKKTNNADDRHKIKFAS